MLPEALFTAVAAEEEEHLEHAIQLLKHEHAKDPIAFETKVGELHSEVVTILAEMLSKQDSVAHCGLCHGSCVKGSLASVGLDITELRGRSINFYLTTLDRLGIRGDVSLGWIAQLPA
jgi:fatty aldehyde decarbonylase